MHAFFGFFVSRSGKRTEYLEWKVWLFSIGAVLGLAGMYLDEGWLVGTAIGVLFLGFLVRFVPSREEEEEAEE